MATNKKHHHVIYKKRDISGIAKVPNIAFSSNLPRGGCRAVEACEVARRNAALRSKATGVYSRT